MLRERRTGDRGPGSGRPGRVATVPTPPRAPPARDPLCSRLDYRRIPLMHLKTAVTTRTTNLSSRSSCSL